LITTVPCIIGIVFLRRWARKALCLLAGLKP